MQNNCTYTRTLFLFFYIPTVCARSPITQLVSYHFGNCFQLNMLVNLCVFEKRTFNMNILNNFSFLWGTYCIKRKQKIIFLLLKLHRHHERSPSPSPSSWKIFLDVVSIVTRKEWHVSVQFKLFVWFYLYLVR